MGNARDARAMVAAAERYTIEKSDDGAVTVGLTLPGRRYGEARTGDAADVGQAVREAYANAAGAKPVAGRE